MENEILNVPLPKILDEMKAKIEKLEKKVAGLEEEKAEKE